MKVILMRGGVLIGICTFLTTSYSSGFSEWLLFRNSAYSKSMSVSFFVVPLSEVSKCLEKTDTDSDVENLLFTEKELREYLKKEDDPPYIVIKIENLGRRVAWGKLKFRSGKPGKGRPYRVIDVPLVGRFPEFFVVPMGTPVLDIDELPVIYSKWESLYVK